MNIGHFLKYSLAILALFYLNSCISETAYYTYEPISEEGWKKQDTLVFNLPDTLLPGSYAMEIGIRHAGKYPYRDIWLELIQYVPSSKPASSWMEKKDTFHIYLANEKGSWNGTGTTGGHFQFLSPQNTFYFSDDSVRNDIGLNTGINSREKLNIKNKYTYEGKKHTLGKAAKYQLRIIQIMTDTLLQHVTDVGIRLTGPNHE